ncbi:hypothetical protein E3N88_42341 [Mikania micrantha]|uniref:Uncharacterized protein n=1 Tax=Mikania micrantha TaxID=192012 RepID=A0A5N6LIX9_9ASTR|nr:hypothetical protein E3N88_42341 [Mikania micrantha]
MDQPNSIGLNSHLRPSTNAFGPNRLELGRRKGKLPFWAANPLGFSLGFAPNQGFGDDRMFKGSAKVSHMVRLKWSHAEFVESFAWTPRTPKSVKKRVRYARLKSFFNDYVPDLNEKPPVEYSYDKIDLNAEPNADVGFDSQALYAQQNDYGFVYDDSKQSNPEETYDEKPAYSNIKWETKKVINDNHNHEPAQNLEGYPYVRRFT